METAFPMREHLQVKREQVLRFFGKNAGSEALSLKPEPAVQTASRRNALFGACLHEFFGKHGTLAFQLGMLLPESFEFRKIAVRELRHGLHDFGIRMLSQRFE